MLDAAFGILFGACVLFCGVAAGYSFGRERMQREAVERGFGKYVKVWSEPDRFTPGGWQDEFFWNGEVPNADDSHTLNA